jgi:hypothetical protein
MMSDKSYVTMEQHACMVCGKAFDTGNILLDTRLRERFERYAVTGWGLCPDDQAKTEEYLALVEVSNAGSGSATLKPSEADRTGMIAHVRRSVLHKIFGEGFEFPPDQPMIFVEVGVIAKLQAIPTVAPAEGS